MPRVIRCTEGVWFDVEPALVSPLRAAARRLKTELRPRFPPLGEEEGRFAIRGVIGNIDLGGGSILEVSPKVGAHEDWIRATLDLLIGTDRIDAAGERLAGLSPPRRSLLKVLAGIYAVRLQRALRREGPIVLIQRREDKIPFLKGKLRITPWIRQAAWQPHHMPVAYDELSADNEFSRALAHVARILASTTQAYPIRSSLLQSARALRPGYAEQATVRPSVIYRSLPTQWAAYAPAWSIAVAVLSQRSLLGARGQHYGITVAIEAWPLLERLLERALSRSVRRAIQAGRQLVSPPKHGTTLLDAPSEAHVNRHDVEPDGRLEEAGQTLATFEAKYKERPQTRDWPDRQDIYQAVSAAAACDSPLAVLVYPGSFNPVWWNVRGTNDQPKHLAAIGLGLFSYRQGTGDEERGQRLLDLLQGRPMPDDDIVATPARVLVP